MASISDKVAQIRQAVYGKDVRESIASGIEAINSEVETTTAKQAQLETSFEQLIINAGNSNAEIVDARGGFDTLRKKLDSYAVNVKDFGAKGDGVTDDTVAIQTAIFYINSIGGGTLYFPNGVYMIKAWDDNYKTGDVNHNANIGYSGGLLLCNNINILGESHLAVLKCIPNDSEAYNVLRIVEKSNITIKNITIEGGKNEHSNTTGEWGHGIMILHSQKIRIENVLIKNLWGDGIYLGILYNNLSNVNNSEILIRDVVIDNASRNGISLCSGENVLIENVVIKNVKRTPPKAAIDIEPEGWGQIRPYLDNVLIRNLQTSNNGYGITFYMSGVNSRQGKVKIDSFRSVTDLIGIIGGSLDESSVEGLIEFENVEIIEAGWAGILLKDYIYTHPKLKFRNVCIKNCNATNKNTDDNPTGWTNGGAFSIYRPSSSTKSTPLGNVEVENLEVIDTRTPQLINTAFLCYDAKNILPLNVRLINPIRLDAIYNKYKQNVFVRDENKVLVANLTYFEVLWSKDWPRTIVKSSGTTTRRYVTILNDVAENNTITLINDSTNGITIDLDKVSPRLKIYPFDNTNRYIRTLQEGASMKIVKMDGKFYAIEIVGTWENSVNP